MNDIHTSPLYPRIKQNLIAIAGLMVFSISVGYLLNQWEPPQHTENPALVAERPLQQQYIPTPDIAQRQVAGESTIQYTGDGFQTALELLQQTAVVTLSESSVHTTVTAINGVNNENGQQWTLYGDGFAITANPAEYTPAANELIEWRYE